MVLYIIYQYLLAIYIYYKNESTLKNITGRRIQLPLSMKSSRSNVKSF